VELLSQLVGVVHAMPAALSSGDDARGRDTRDTGETDDLP
jgi:hypothetical protein